MSLWWLSLSYQIMLMYVNRPINTEFVFILFSLFMCLSFLSYSFQFVPFFFTSSCSFAFLGTLWLISSFHCTYPVISCSSQHCFCRGFLYTSVLSTHWEWKLIFIHICGYKRDVPIQFNSWEVDICCSGIFYTYRRRQAYILCHLEFWEFGFVWLSSDFSDLTAD